MSTSDLRNPELEAAIVANPDDVGPYVVYADWLSERGDPRGELVIVQLQRETSPDDAALAAREQALLAAHRDEWTDYLQMVSSQRAPIVVAWRRGFIDAASIRASYESDDAATTYAALAGLPVAAALRQLEVGAEISHHGERPHGTEVLAAMRAAPLRALRTLRFTAFDHDISWTHVGELAAAGDALHAVEALSLETGHICLGQVQLPRLRTLELVTGGLPAHVLADLAAQTWPHLTSLVLYLGTEDYGGSCTVQDTQPILDGDSFPAVSHLALCNSTLADELAGRVATSRILPRLRTLDLSKGVMGREGARDLLRHARAFSHLERLDLSGNYFTEAECRQLATLCPEVLLGAQKREGEYGRYVDLGE